MRFASILHALTIASTSAKDLQFDDNQGDSASNMRPRPSSSMSFMQDQLRRKLATSNNFGIPIEKVEAVQSGNLNAEFGVEEVGGEKAKELYDSCSNFQLDKAIEDPEAKYPYLVCGEANGKSGWQRKRELYQFLVESDPEEPNDQLDQTMLPTNSSHEITSLYNDQDLTCFVVAMKAGTAFNLSDYGAKGIIVQPVLLAMKLRANLMQEFLRRSKELLENSGLIQTDVNETISPVDEIPLDTKLDIELCTGQTEEEIAKMGDRIREFLKGNFTNNTCYAEYDLLNITELPARVEFWKEIFRLGINSAEGCDEFVDSIESELQPSARNDELSIGVTLFFSKESDSGSTTSLACALSLVGALAYMNEVCSIELLSDFRSQNAEAQWITQSGSDESRPFWNKGLTGSGQVVAVSDSGLDTDNCYFYDANDQVQKDGSTKTSVRKVVQYIPFVDTKDEEGGHGTHVSGSIAGNRAPEGGTATGGAADGIAKDAKLAFLDVGSGGPSLSIPTDRTYLLETGKSAGAKLHSASWGSMNQNYGAMSRDIDEYLFYNWDFLMIVAAGNNGGGNNRGSILDPGLAKNVLTVGATQSEAPDLAPFQRGMDYLADFSSRGPTTDGRRKPDVVAPGQSILSSRAIPSQTGECDPLDGRIPTGGSGYREGLMYMQGTSMATPITTGAAALVRQYFIEGFFPTGSRISENAFQPSGTLVKAVLANGGQEIAGIHNGGTTTTPSSAYDIHQGFGRVNLLKSLPLAGENTFIGKSFDRQSVNDGETKKHTLKIDKPATCLETQMRATLAWADPPGGSGCVRCLLNDLDLSITKNGTSTVYYPNGLSSPDTVNNVERIIIDDIQDGDVFIVNVKASNLDRDKQVFSLIVTGCLDCEPDCIFLGAELPSSAPCFLSSIVAAITALTLSLLFVLNEL